MFSLRSRFAFFFAIFAFAFQFARADLTIYTDSLATNWQNWSWATVDVANTTVAHNSNDSIQVNAGAWQAMYLSYVGSPINTSGYTKLSFWINGGPTGGQLLQVSAVLSGNGQPPVAIGPIAANTWTQIQIPLANLGAANATTFTGFWIQDATGNGQPTFYVDDVSLISGAPTSPPLQVDGQGIFDDGYVNGWQNWSWASVSLDTNTVHTGAASIAVNAGPYQALAFHHAAFSTQDYSDFVFYANGGPTGGQVIQVIASLNGSPQAAVVVPALAANTWTKIDIPLSALGAANQSNLTDLWIQEGQGKTVPTFYIDDAYLQAAPPPAQVNVNVNVNSIVNTVDPRLFGLNTAVWDPVFDTATTATLLNDIDIQALRFPGGSTSDTYHWQTNMSDGDNFQWATSFDAFASIATTVGAQVYITANYGTGTPEEAAAWVQYSNVTKHYGFKYWEIGNENYGTWEADNNTRPHDPVTYANRFKQYYQEMKAVDPTIKVGAVIVASEDDDANYSDESVTNPRTGVVHKGWSGIMLATLKSIGITPDFVSYHRYEQGPGGENDAFLLNVASSWKNDAATIRQILNDYLGAAGPQVEIDCTENNSVYSNPGKQTTSLVNGLYLADSIGNIMQTEFRSLIWWDLRNGQEGGNNNSPSLYGWRNYGDYGIVDGANPVAPADLYPTYYVYKLLTHFARGGESVLTATSDYDGLGVYSVKSGNSVRVLLINKKATHTLNASVNINGFAPATSAQVFTYGIPQDTAAQTGTGSADVASTSMVIPGNTFTYSAAPYSANVITLNLDSATWLKMSPSGYVLNRRTNQMVQTITITNTSASAVNGPIYLALDGLSANTSLANSAGTTSQTNPTGSPYILVSNSSIASGASVTVTLNFAKPATGGITYTPRLIVISGNP